MLYRGPRTRTQPLPVVRLHAWGVCPQLSSNPFLALSALLRFQNGERDGMSFDTRPGNFGLRFSIKAETPSLTSAVPPNSTESGPSILSSSNGSGAPE